MVPIEYNGSLILYRRFIRPQFLKYQPNVDSFISNTRDAGEYKKDFQFSGWSRQPLNKRLQKKLKNFL